ncbi:MepB family protein [Neptunitalea lumnitzerae]|uniref:MepB family protein n=1 Tax=Neptunitalea lumnitzerae TaxID=2965509 RepID=A0ABQ5MJ69_9FLAO|nr:MepB family protein [Neptunitalea sp. Y10]GLB49372.1 hypothetical protein Y10_17400 [Neptunitalea sp. Y10]
MDKQTINHNLSQIDKKVYTLLSYEISNYRNENEGLEYDACQFTLNNSIIISRSAKITPKKIGQFVTFWKRSTDGVTTPYHDNDNFNYYVINVTFENKIGQFVFPKSELILRGILSTDKKEGKRGFRVYPLWDHPQSRQAIKTQIWQLKYFYEIKEFTDLAKVQKLYS